MTSKNSYHSMAMDNLSVKIRLLLNTKLYLYYKCAHCAIVLRGKFSLTQILYLILYLLGVYFDFSNFHGLRLILGVNHWDLSPHIFVTFYWTNVGSVQNT